MANQIKMVFDNQFQGILTGHHGSVQVGSKEGSLVPYDMVLGGLGACLNHTFQSVLDKRKIQIHAIHYDILGTKRDTVPTTLELVDIKVSITGADPADITKIEKAFEQATRYCSVYQTISHVAKMKYTVLFN